MTNDEARGVADAATKLGGKLINSLPAQFLGLCIIALLFNLILFWFIDKRESAREKVLGPIISACLKEVPIDVVKELLDQQQRK